MALSTSATEIANYRGNAAAALGASAAGATGVYGATDAEHLNRVVDQVAASNLQRNKDLYDLKIKNRNELFNQISSGQLSLNQLMPNDRDRVRKKYLQPIRDMLISNPDLKNDPDEYVKFQELTKEFNEAKTYGQHRFLMLSGMDKDIATETDPEKRKRMEQHRNQTAGQGLFDEVKPYQQTLDWTDDIMVKGKPVTSTSEKMEGDYLVTTTNSRTPVADFINGVNHNYTDSPNKSLANQMDVYRDSFLKLPTETKASTIAAWNNKIAEINKDEGRAVIEPIKFSIIKSPDGKETIEVTETAPRIVLAESLLKGYSKTSSVTPKASKLPSDIRKNDAQAAKWAAEVKYKIPAETANLYAKAADSKAGAAKKHEETKAIKRGVSKEQAEGDYYINQLRSMVDPKHYEGLPTIGLEKSDKDAYPELAKQGFAGTVLRARDVTGQVRSALSPDEVRSLSVPMNSPQAGGKVVLTPPDDVIQNTQDPKDPYFITITYPKQKIDDLTKLPQKDANGKEIPPGKPVVNIIRPGKIIERMVKGNVGEESATKEYQNMQHRYQEVTGSNNINGTIMGSLNSPDYKVADAPAPAPAKKAPPKAPKKKVPVPAAVKSKGDSLFVNFGK